MKRGCKLAFSIVLLFLAFVLVSCDEGFSSGLDNVFIEYILRDTEEGDAVIEKLDAYLHEGYCYYQIKYNYKDGDEWESLNAVYRGRYGNVTMYYNLNWENDSAVLPMKDTFYDAVEYGEHKSFTSEEIEKLVRAYYSVNK